MDRGTSRCPAYAEPLPASGWPLVAAASDVDPGRHRCTLRAGSGPWPSPPRSFIAPGKQEQVERLESDGSRRVSDLGQGAEPLPRTVAPARGLLRLSHAALDPRARRGGRSAQGDPGQLAAWQAPLWPAPRDPPHHGGVYAVACSPDGKVLLTVCGVVVSGGSGARPGFGMPPLASPSARPCAARAPIRSVAFSPDGRTIVTGGPWVGSALDVAPRGKPLGALWETSGPVVRVAYTQDAECRDGLRPKSPVLDAARARRFPLCRTSLSRYALGDQRRRCVAGHRQRGGNSPDLGCRRPINRSGRN